MSTDKKYYLDSLRGIAALFVALHHANFGSILNNNLTENGWIMVDFFFVLSGYVIALNYSEKLANIQDVARFQFRRFLRLYPLHLVMIVVFLAIEAFHLYEAHHLQLVPYGSGLGDAPISYLLKNLTLMHGFQTEELSLNYPSWSISTEFVTYLIFALIVCFLGRNRTIKFLIIGVLLLLSAWEISQNTQNPVVVGFERCIFAFFIGALVLEFEKRVEVIISGRIAAIMALVVIAVVGQANFVAVMPASLLVFPFLCGALIYVLNHAPADAGIKRLLLHPILVWLGATSYGIYMIHAAVWEVFKLAFRHLTPNLAEVGIEEGIVVATIHNPLLALFVHVLGLALIVWSAHLSFYKFERPVMAFAKDR